MVMEFPSAVGRSATPCSGRRLLDTSAGSPAVVGSGDVDAAGVVAGRPAVLPAKYTLPRRTPNLLHRPRLASVLDAADPAGVVLVSAPAGYGKTLLLADWAARRAGRTVWLTLDGG